MRSLVAGNWKMNGLAAALGELGALKDGLAQLQTRSGPPACDVLVCPPATLIAQAAWKVQGAFALGGQDCHAKPSGAFTGDVSAEMLKDAGASHVIVGHSERRQYHGESDADVAAKAQAAWRAGLKAIICIGETEAQREAGTHNSICSTQLDGSVPDGASAAGGDPVENGGFPFRVAGGRFAGGGGVQHPEHAVFGEGDMFDDLENAPAVRRRAGLVGYFGYGVHGGMKGQGAFFQNSEDFFASFRVHAL